MTEKVLRMPKRLIVVNLVFALALTLVPALTPGGERIERPGTRPRSSADVSLAGAANRPSFGVHFSGTSTHFTWRQRKKLLTKMKRAGVEWVRIDLGWPSFQPKNKRQHHKWYTRVTNRVLKLAKRRGIKVIAQLSQTPKWANGGRGMAVPPNRYRDYGRIARWAARKFRGKVNAWQIWNEPNHKHFWTGSARDYARLLKVAYPMIKEGDPSVPVLIGGTSYNDVPWLRNMYKGGAKGNFDVMATNPYQGVADWRPEKPDDGTKYTLAHVRAVHRLMKRRGDGHKEIWFTEFGWSSHKNWPGIENWERGVSKKKQAAYAVRAIKFVAEKFPYVTKMIWYSERNMNFGHPQKDNYGVLYRNLSNKPIYRRLKRFLRG